MVHPSCWLIPTFALVSCATSPRILIEPIEPTECLPVEYSGRLATSASTFPEAPESYGEEPDPTVETEVIEVGCRLVAIPRENAEQMLSRCDSDLGANRMPRATAEDRFLSLTAIPSHDVIHAPRLALYHGQRGTITIANQVAYLDSFRLEVGEDGDSLIADPVVGVVQEGFLMELLVGDRSSDSSLPLDLTLQLADLEQPIVEAEGRLPGTETPVTLQVPVVATQHLHVSAALREDEALVLGALPWRDHERALLALITIDAYPIEDHDEVGER